MANALKRLDDELNGLLRAGKLIDALRQFYADDVTMQENTDSPTVGLAANLEREQAFFGSLERFEPELLSQAVGDGVTMNEYRLVLTMKNGTRMTLQQVSVRRWREGKVASERFYHQ
jgi:hypothetical protein